MTGVLVLGVGGSLLLQEANDTRQQRRITTLLCALCGLLRSSALRTVFNAESAEGRRDREEGGCLTLFPALRRMNNQMQTIVRRTERIRYL
jgi:hypothetical protein